MLHQSKSVRPSLVRVMILSLLVGVLLAIYNWSSKPNPKVVKHSVGTSPAEVLEYWEKKKKDVKPKPLPEVPAEALEKLDERTSSPKPSAKRC